MDNVNHPKHYNSHPSGIECIEIVRHMTFSIGNVIKYLWRAGLKTSETSSHSGDALKRLEDLKKAEWYLKDAIKEAQDNVDALRDIKTFDPKRYESVPSEVEAVSKFNYKRK